jgi:putative ABC transport system permease protein
MKTLDMLKMAISAIARNKARSVLTTLGIIIGVASVIAMVHLGQAATVSVTERISSMGSNLLILQPGTGERGPGGKRSSGKAFQTRDYIALETQLLDAVVAPVASSTQTLVWSGTNYPGAVIGTTETYFDVRNWEVTSGRAIERDDVVESNTVCAVGATVAKEVFSGADPVGELLRVGRTSCRVIGVMATKGASFGEDLDASIVMPISVVQQRFLGSQDVRQIYISAHDKSALPSVTAEVNALMRERRGIQRGAQDDFNIRDMQEIAETLEGTTRTLTMLLGAIAAVSLLVGGIGIMNIMLVSVSERTREIGVRLAIGALVRDVLAQFLAEAIALSMFGGLVGVVLGVGATWLTTTKMNLPFVLTPEVMLVGFGFSVLIGVVFGYVPARKAANLNPIEALRYE